MALLILAALVYLPFFLLSFLCPKHPHVLNVYLAFPAPAKPLSQLTSRNGPSMKMSLFASAGSIRTA